MTRTKSRARTRKRPARKGRNTHHSLSRQAVANMLRDRMLELGDDDVGLATYKRFHGHRESWHTASDGTVFLHNRAIAVEIQTNTDSYTSWRFQTQPGVEPLYGQVPISENTTTFGGISAQLAALSRNFQLYKLHGLRYHYIPEVPATIAGGVGMGWTPDPSDDYFPSTKSGFQSMASLTNSNFGQISQPLSLGIDHRDLSALGNHAGFLLVRGADLGDTDQPNIPQFANKTAYSAYDAGAFQMTVHTDTVNPDVTGWLAVEYIIELSSLTLQNVYDSAPIVAGGALGASFGSNTQMQTDKLFDMTYQDNGKTQIWQPSPTGRQLIAHAYGQVGGFVGKVKKYTSTLLTIARNANTAVQWWNSLTTGNGAEQLFIGGAFADNGGSVTHLLEAPAGPIIEELDDLPFIEADFGAVGGEFGSISLSQVAPIALAAEERARCSMCEKAVFLMLRANHLYLTEPARAAAKQWAISDPVGADGGWLETANFISSRVLPIARGMPLPREHGKRIMATLNLLEADASDIVGILSPLPGWADPAPERLLDEAGASDAPTAD